MKRGCFIIYILSLSIIITIFGCIPPQKSIIRYQKVNIPNYTKTDYEKLLALKNNDEVKYNAICNLIGSAPEYAKILQQGIPEESSTNHTIENINKYNTAKSIYNSIKSHLNSDDENVKAASLMFISAFASNYKNNTELLNIVVKVKAKSKRTQYEQLNILINICDSNTILDQDLINRFLNSKNWLLNSMTYLLLGKIKSEAYHDRFINEYKITKEEYNKLLILESFEGGYGSDVFNLLANELLTSESEKVKNKIISILKYNKKDDDVINWIINNYQKIEKSILKDIIDEYYSEVDNIKGSTFYKIFLDSKNKQLLDLIQSNNLFENLYNCFNKKEKKKYFDMVRNAVSKIPSLEKSWLEYKDKKKRKKLEDTEKKKREEGIRIKVLPKYTLLLEKFLNDSKQLFAETNMDEKEIEEAIKEIREFLQILKDEEKD